MVEGGLLRVSRICVLGSASVHGGTRRGTRRHSAAYQGDEAEGEGGAGDAVSVVHEDVIGAERRVLWL